MKDRAKKKKKKHEKMFKKELKVKRIVVIFKALLSLLRRLAHRLLILTAVIIYKAWFSLAHWLQISNSNC